ncbi:hypothetical protein BGV66_19590 [Burkholderia ubonensis]|uniref:Uncharacterized protein n=2 Tax=Burkholderia ubonensis TaxID=101571 RepID=A0ABD6Q0W9_9BURK|nr:hypothetical protein BGV66_19590 [Burkholderia ubonensis]
MQLGCDRPTFYQAITMAKPILTILLKRPFPDAFRFIEASLQSLGFLLVNPESGQVTHWSDDGEQIPISRTKISDDASTGTVKNVQFWKTNCDDLFVSWADTSSGWRFSFHLNGVAPELKVALATALSNSVLIDLKQQYENECAFRIDFD